MSKIIKESLIKQGIELIPVEDLNITLDLSETVGYDLTIKDNYTFCTDDGIFLQDSMNVYVPISKEAQQEAKDRMIVATSNESIGKPNFSITNEMLLGLYYISTIDNGGIYTDSKVELTNITDDQFKNILKVDPGKRILITYKGKKIETTVGKLILNYCLPKDYDLFWNGPANKKTIQQVLERTLSIGKNDYARTVDLFMRMGFYFSTKYPQTVSLDMLKIPKKIEEEKSKLETIKDLKDQDALIKKLEKDMVDHLDKDVPDLSNMIKSGAAKSKSQIRQILVCKGLVEDPEGNILPPITSSFTDGYKPKEYFNAAAGARTGIIGRALGTASGGYEYRKVIYVVGNVKCNKELLDCGTKNTLDIKLTEELFSR